jgi:hypothetical protein
MFAAHDDSVPRTRFVARGAEMVGSGVEPVGSARLALRYGGERWRRVYAELTVWWRAARLDRQLAEGASPVASAALTVHARRITATRGRARVAAGLERVRRDALAPRPGYSATIRPHRREALAARTVLDALVRRLRAPERVSARGVALLRVLLTDGSSALYRPGEDGALGSALRSAAIALEPPRERSWRSVA